MRERHGRRTLALMHTEASALQFRGRSNWLMAAAATAGRQEHKQRGSCLFLRRVAAGGTLHGGRPCLGVNAGVGAAQRRSLSCGAVRLSGHVTCAIGLGRAEGGVARVRARRGVGVGRRIYPFAGTSVQKGSTRSAHRFTPSPLSPHPTITLLQSSLLHSPSLSIFSRTLVVADTSSLVETFTLQITTPTHSLYRTYPEFLCENLPTVFHLILTT